MSSTTVEPPSSGPHRRPEPAYPRRRSGPALPEIIGAIAGIIALAIALAPSMAGDDPEDRTSGASDTHSLAAVQAPPTTEVPGETDLALAVDEPAANQRCSTSVLGGAPAEPGAYCALPPREKAQEEVRFVGLSFRWPRFPGADGH